MKIRKMTNKKIVIEMQEKYWENNMQNLWKKNVIIDTIQKIYVATRETKKLSTTSLLDVEVNKNKKNRFSIINQNEWNTK